MLSRYHLIAFAIGFAIIMLAIAHQIASPTKTLTTSTEERFLRYICTSRIVCGGWSDRWRGAVLAQLLARWTGRTFRMEWKKRPQNKSDPTLTLDMVFEDNSIFDPIPKRSTPCKRVNWIDVSAPPVHKLYAGAYRDVRCINLHANMFLSGRHASLYTEEAARLWNRLRLRTHLGREIASAPDNMRCAQIRNGGSEKFKDCTEEGTKCGGGVGFHGDSKRGDAYEQTVFEWLKLRGGATHLWTDWEAQEERFLVQNPRAVRVRGPIKHVDRAARISQRAFERVVVEWALIAKCSQVWPMSGYIRTGLFLAPNATIFREASVKAMIREEKLAV